MQEVLFRHFTICTMSDTVIRVENLSKKYAIASQKQERYTSLRDEIADKGLGTTWGSDL